MTADPRRARAIEILSRLVAFDTESAKSNLALIDYVETLLREEGVTFTRAPTEAGDKAAIFATIGPMADGGVVPWRVKSGRAILSRCARPTATSTGAGRAT